MPTEQASEHLHMHPQKNCGVGKQRLSSQGKLLCYNTKETPEVERTQPKLQSLYPEPDRPPWLLLCYAKAAPISTHTPIPTNTQSFPASFDCKTASIRCQQPCQLLAQPAPSGSLSHTELKNLPKNSTSLLKTSKQKPLPQTMPPLLLQLPQPPG